MTWTGRWHIISGLLPHRPIRLYRTWAGINEATALERGFEAAKEIAAAEGLSLHPESPTRWYVLSRGSSHIDNLTLVECWRGCICTRSEEEVNAEATALRRRHDELIERLNSRFGPKWSGRR